MFSKGRNTKAQSAMEYLMTYGWAILIIAIVLAALFALGIFSSSSFIGTACIAASGYECSSPILHAGSFNAIVGQNTGTSWATANIIFVTGGGSPSSIAVNTPATCVLSLSSGLTSGQTVQFGVTNSITVSSGVASCPAGTALPTTVGSSSSGAVWAEYTVSGISGFLWSQIATVTLKAS